MKQVLGVLLAVISVLGSAGAEVVGPMVRAETDFPGYAVFQMNGCDVKRGEAVCLQRSGKFLADGKVTETADGRCLVKFDDDIPFYRGDLLHKKAKGQNGAAPSFGARHETTPAYRPQLSRHVSRPKVKAGRSPHVLTPAELAAQSRRSSVYSLGTVQSVQEMAQQSRRTSVFTLGRTLSVEEFAKQMNR